MTHEKPLRVLMSSVCQPFGVKYGDGLGTSYEGTHQIMWAQGIFRTRATTTQWGIDFIAHNLQAPTTTLHYPTMARFIAEIRKGYDYIGIAFVATTKHKMIPMVEAIRRYAPQTKVVLGGYGTALSDDEIGIEVDHICRGEGVAFMRDLLGEPVDRPIDQPYIKQQTKLFTMNLGGPVGYVFAGLGCPHGCDFCATSHYFKRRHIRFLPDGRSILHAIERLRASDPDMVDFWISDEDFLLNQKRGRGFLEAIRESDQPPLAISAFSSVKALSQYHPSELVEMGIDWVWVGYEGQRAGYAKMNGRPYDELFADLRAHGISVLASMIIGFDYQTPEIIEQEFEDLIALRPTMSQFLIYGPAHGTPLYERMEAEGRLNADAFADASKLDGFSLTFAHPHISKEEMEALQKELYHKEFQRLGPSIFRCADTYLEGSIRLADHPAPRVRAKAKAYADIARRARMVIPAAKRYVSPEVGVWLDELSARMTKHTRPFSLKERSLAALAPVMLWYTGFKMRRGIDQQPTFSTRSWRMGEPAVAPLAVSPVLPGQEPLVLAGQEE